MLTSGAVVAAVNLANNAVDVVPVATVAIYWNYVVIDEGAALYGHPLVGI